MKPDLFEFDLQLHAGDDVALPPISDDADASRGDASQEADLDNDFDSTIARETEAARGRSIESFAGAEDEEPEDELADILEDPQPRETRQMRRERERQEAKARARGEQPAAGEQPAQQNGEQPAAGAADAAQPPAAAKPVVLDDEEKFTIQDGTVWPRRDIVAGLREREGLLRSEAQWRQTFGSDAAQAAQNWGPIIESIRKDPPLGEFLQSVYEAHVQSPAKLAYLRKAAKFFDDETAANGGGAPAGAPSQTERELRAQIQEQGRKIAQMEQRDQQAATANAAAAVQREATSLKEKYPALKDPKILEMVATRALTGVQRDPNYTLTRAADELADYLTRLATAPATVAQPAPAVVPAPALAGGSGASPTGARKTGNNHPRVFPDPDAAVRDWENGGRQAAGFK